MWLTFYVQFGDCKQENRIDSKEPSNVWALFEFIKLSRSERIKVVVLFEWFLRYPLSLYSRKYTRNAKVVCELKVSLELLIVAV